MSEWRVIQGDCLAVLKSMPDASVDAVVTSPPYNAGMEYDHWESDEHYYGFVTSVLDECYRVLRPCGRLVWQVMFTASNKHGRHFLGGKTSWLIQERFACVDTFLWSATPLHELAVRTNTAWGSWRSPSCPSMRGIPGVVFVAGKESRTDPANGRETSLTADEFKEYTKGLWFIRQDEMARKWEAPYPVALIDRVLRLYTYNEATILDPFTGSGTTGVACVQTGRNFIGIELDPKSCELARRRIADAVPLCAEVAQ